MQKKEDILAILKKHKVALSRLGVRNIGLFGSYVRGEQTGESDIDVLLDFDPDQENFDNFMAACDLIEELFGNQKVDVVTKNGLSPYIGPEILQSAVYV